VKESNKRFVQAIIFAILSFFHLYWAAGGRFGSGMAIPTIGYAKERQKSALKLAQILPRASKCRIIRDLCAIYGDTI
jgi:hypothetical protein